MGAGGVKFQARSSVILRRNMRFRAPGEDGGQTDSASGGRKVPKRYPEVA